MAADLCLKFVLERTRTDKTPIFTDKLTDSVFTKDLFGLVTAPRFKQSGYNLQLQLNQKLGILKSVNNL